MRRTIPILLAASALPRTLLGQGHAEHLGTVHFPISCSAAAQQQFDNAVALLHNFVYPQDLDAFREVAKADSSCAMAYWGVAMSRRANPLIGAPDSSALRDGLAAAEQGRAYPCPRL
jgi:hypothetical protein